VPCNEDACCGLIALFEHVVSSRGQPGRRYNVELSCPSQIYYEPKLGRLHNRQISRIFTFENTSNKPTGLPERVCQTGPAVRNHQAALPILPTTKSYELIDHQNKRQEGTGGGAVTRFALVRQLVRTHLGSGFAPSDQLKIRY